MKTTHRAVRVGMSLSDSGLGEGALARHTRRAAALALVAAMAATPQVALAASKPASVPAVATAATKAKAAKAASKAITPAADETLEGSIGATDADKVSWKLVQTNDDAANPTYKLVISGTGAMADFEVTNDTDTRPWVAHAGSITAVQIGEGVTSLGNSAFRNLTALTTANIPASITKLGDHLFRGDTALTTVTWADGFTAPTDTVDTDSNSQTYTGAYVPTSMFDGCTSLGQGQDLGTWLPRSFTGVGCAAFRGTAFSADFGAWNNLSYIGAYGLAQMPNLTSVTVRASWTFGLRGDSKVSAAFQASGLTSVVFEDGVKEAPYSAFSKCASLNSVSLPDSLATIGFGAFSETTSLKSVDLNKVTAVDDYAFNGSGLEGTLTIPASIENVGSRAFLGNRLTGVDVQAKDLKTIGGMAFSGNKDLTSLTVEEGAKVSALDSSYFRAGTDAAASPLASVTIDGLCDAINLSGVATLTSYSVNGANDVAAAKLPALDTITVTGDEWQVSNYAFAKNKTLKTLAVDADKVGSQANASAAFRSSALEHVTFTGSDVALQEKMFMGAASVASIDLSQVEKVTFGSDVFGDSTTADWVSNFNPSAVIYVKDAKDAAAARTKTGLTANSKGVVLVVNGGSVDATKAAGFGAVTKSGQTATWYENEGLTGTPVTTPQPGHTYYAKWVDAVSKVTGDLNFDPQPYGSTPAEKTLTVTGGKPASVTSSTTAFTVRVENGAVVVAPASGLAAGIYQGTILVTTDDDVTHQVTASYQVQKAAVHNVANDTTVHFVQGGVSYDVGSLFDLDANAGKPTYEIVDPGTTGATISGRVITVKHAGAVKVKLTTAAGANSLADTVGVTATLTVARGEVTINPSVSALSVAFGEAYDEVTGHAASYGYRLADATVTYQDANGTQLAAKPTEAGSYKAVLSYAGSDDFEAAQVEVPITIGKAAMTASVAGWSGTYDGKAHSITVKAPAGAAVTYSTDGSKTWTATAPSFTNAGTYEVRVRVTLANHDDFEGTATVEIAKAAVDMSGVSFKDATVTYDGTEHVLEVAGELPEGVTGVTYANNKLTHAGVTQATATFAVDANHVAPSPLTATLTVERAAQAIKVDKAQLTLVAGETGKIAVSGAAEGAQVSWESSDPSVATVAADGTVHALKAGSVTLKVSASATGDYLASNAVSVKLTVTAKQGTADNGKTDAKDSDKKDASASNASDKKKADSSALPQTGDDSAATVAVVGAAGVAALGAAMLTRRRDR